METPLLIPSFSSKGFGIGKVSGESQIQRILNAASEFLTDVYLVSAYDLYYGKIDTPNQLPAIPELLFLDSGGYEISTDRDYSQVIDPLPAPNDWDVDRWLSVVSTWPEEIPLVAVNYDHHKERSEFGEQVRLARRRFRECPSHCHLFLIKPTTEDQATLKKALKVAKANVEDLGSFDIIGVTEKELGHSFLDRMVQIAQLRIAMDQVDVRAPIHVFGALDPLSVILYYISGAEIFDGLTWLRYAYDAEAGQCVYPQNHGALKYGLDVSDDRAKVRVMSDNYYYLMYLQRRMQEFHATGDFAKLGPHAQFVRDAVDSLETRLRRKS